MTKSSGSISRALAGGVGALVLAASWTLRGDVHSIECGRLRPRIAPPGDSGRQRDGRRRHDRLRHPGGRSPPDQPVFALAGIERRRRRHDRRLHAAGLEPEHARRRRQCGDPRRVEGKPCRGRRRRHCDAFLLESAPGTRHQWIRPSRTGLRSLGRKRLRQCRDRLLRRDGSRRSPAEAESDRYPGRPGYRAPIAPSVGHDDRGSGARRSESGFGKFLRRHRDRGRRVRDARRRQLHRHRRDGKGASPQLQRDDPDNLFGKRGRWNCRRLGEPDLRKFRFRHTLCNLRLRPSRGTGSARTRRARRRSPMAPGSRP